MAAHMGNTVANTHGVPRGPHVGTLRGKHMGPTWKIIAYTSVPH